MDVESVMTRDPATIAPGATLDDAIARMDEFEIRHLPVIEGGRMIGLVSDRTLLEATGWLPARVRDIYQGHEVSRSGRVRDVMHEKVACLSPRDSIETLFAVARTHHLDCVPVQDRDELVGILTERDVLAAFVENCRRLESEPSSDIDPRIEKIMSDHPAVIEVGADLAQARATMASVRAHHLPVVQCGRVIGMLSDRDLRKAAGRGRPDDHDVRELMSRPVIDIEPTSRLSDAAASMLAGHFSSLPIVADGELVGILTMTDAMGPCLRALRSSEAA